MTAPPPSPVPVSAMRSFRGLARVGSAPQRPKLRLTKKLGTSTWGAAMRRVDSTSDPRIGHSVCLPALQSLPHDRRERLTGPEGEVRLEKFSGDFFYLPAAARANFLAWAPPFEHCFFELAVPALLRATAPGRIQGVFAVRGSIAENLSDVIRTGTALCPGTTSHRQFASVGPMAARPIIGIQCACATTITV